jgi:uncharacterized pyridoxal phosphate-containing UPF0001 family protein
MTTSPASFANPDLVARVAANLADVQRRITSSGRDLASVRVVAVTKTFGADAVVAAAMNGLTHVGENYVDELCAKREASTDVSLTWHFLGAVQSNKIKRIVACADVVCGVTRAKEFERLATLAPERRCYVEVDFTNEASRHGVPERDVAALVARGRALGVNVQGLMTVAPRDARDARRAFGAIDTLCNDLGLVERSMGMSDDLELACELGTTEVRIGRALFGARVAR